ncbi:MAG: hypothetical protein IMX02_07960 [Limnochordaceae bacterium]|nr:hypothetical protein [Limnochordaceae bacterium]
MADDVAEERRMILKMLEEGKITPDQAVELLKALQGPAAEGAPEPGSERTVDLGRWAEQFGSRVSELADEFAQRVQRVVASADVGEKVGDVADRMADVGRTVADRIAQAFGQFGTLALPAHAFTDEMAGEFAEGAVPQVHLATPNGTVRVHTDPQAGRTWRLTVRKRVRARTPEEARSQGQHLVSVTQGPTGLTARAESWSIGSADLELVLPP